MVMIRAGRASSCRSRDSTCYSDTSARSTALNPAAFAPRLNDFVEHAAVPIDGSPMPVSLPPIKTTTSSRCQASLRWRFAAQPASIAGAGFRGPSADRLRDYDAPFEQQFLASRAKSILLLVCRSLIQVALSGP